MTEKEKMIAGLSYDSADTELTQDRKQAMRLTFALNHLHPDAATEREEILRQLIGDICGDFFITGPFYCDYGYNLSIGENFYANYNFVVLDCAPVTIGNNVLVGPNVSIYTAGHPLHYEQRQGTEEFAAAISIGNNIWIGGNVVINPGVKIGDNTVIGSGSVVTKDIPKNVVAAGNPCRVIREITEEDKAAYLKNYK